MLIERSKHFVMHYHEGANLILLKRQPVPWTSFEEMATIFGRLFTAIDRNVKPRPVLFVDTRGAMPRNDPEFEVIFAGHRRSVNARFRKVAILVQTAVGRLQVQRHAIADGDASRVFIDSAEALAYLEVPKDTLAGLGSIGA